MRWHSRRPAELGLDPAALDDAVAYAISHETPWATDLAAVIREQHQDEGPFAETIGPIKDRGGPNGLVLRHGYVVAEWGDTDRVDMTFSASKSYVATTAGLALDRGLIRDLDDPVREYVDDGGFDSLHNAAITWRHLLQQTSEWEGTLWGKPDRVDRNRAVQGDAIGAVKGAFRPLQPPGSFWEYNDVRVNRLALALLRC